MRKIIGRLLCLLSLHNWRYSFKPKDSLSIGWTGYSRKCRRCGFSQFEYNYGGWR